MKKNKAKKVFLAMSGGVDSSVAAVILLRQGFDVTGVYMKNFSEESFDGKFAEYCPWRRDLADVKKVCRILKIPMKVYNFEKEYNRRVIDDFFEKERKALTPNPDVVCNNEIKFGLFLKKALSDGADFIATGHYAKITEKKLRTGKQKVIVRAKDSNKDQTYFLCGLKPSQIQKALFPLGNYTKPEIRKIARASGLPTAEKQESMGICFVGEVDFEEFLKARISETPGEIVDTQGKILGLHKGLSFYTIGQRQGLNISGPVPYYVVRKLKKKNQLVVVSGSKASELFARAVEVTGLSWAVANPGRLPLNCRVSIRYRQKPQNAILRQKDKKVIIEFRSRQRAITPGQYCAIYDRRLLLGGAVIKHEYV